MKVWPLKARRRVVPKAASVATVVDITAAETPIISDRTVAAFTSSFTQASPYHCSENPPQTATELEPLNERMSRETMGRDRRTKAAMAIDSVPFEREVHFFDTSLFGAGAEHGFRSRRAAAEQDGIFSPHDSYCGPEPSDRSAQNRLGPLDEHIRRLRRFV